MKTKFAAALAAGAAALSISGAATAAVTLTEGSFGGTGVHSSTDADQTGTTVFGVVGNSSELVTFSSSGTLFLNGQGEAIIDGDPLNDLLVSFAQGYSIVTWNVELPGGAPPPGGYAMTVDVNGGGPGLTFLVDPLEPPQKYILTATEGDVINTIGFTFEPGVNDVKQFRLTVGNPVPEPATWAMMILGFGGVGALARRRRSQPVLA